MDFRVAVPSKAGVPVFDFHDCVEVTVVEINDGRISRMRTAPVDTKDGDLLPRQLEDMGIDILLAGGIRREVLEGLNRSRINLVTGARGKTVEGLVLDFLGEALSIASHTGGRRPAE